MKYLGKLFLFSCALLLVQCAKKFVPDPPNEFYAVQVVPKEISQYQFPMSIPIADLQKMANEQIKDLIFEEDQLDKENYHFKVWKKGEILLTGNNQTLSYQVPIKIWAKTGFALLGASHYEETNFELTLHLESQISLDDTWKISTKTKVDHIDWLSKPVVKFGPIEVDVSAIFQRILTSKEKLIASSLDAYINKDVDFRKYVGGIWKEMQEPIKMDGPVETWIKISPMEIAMSPISFSNQEMKMAFSVKAFTESITGAKPGSAAIPLPNLGKTNLTTPYYDIQLMSQISDDQLTALAKKEFEGKNFIFKEGKYNVTVSSIKVYGSGQNLVIKSEVKGNLNGTIYLKGIPSYDSVAQQIYLKNLDFDLDTKQKLAKTANWLSHDSFVKKMQPYFVFNIKDQLDAAAEAIRLRLKEHKPNPYVTLRGDLQSLQIRKIFLLQRQVILQIQAKGKVEVKISGL